MRWFGCESPQSKIYQKRVLTTMLLYLAVVVSATRMVRHEHPVGWLLYCYALAPVVPVMCVLGYMGIYLRDEKDEFLRMMTVWSLLVGTAALLGTVVVSDFLRSYTPVGDLPPFTSFTVFCLSFGLAQLVQQIRNRSTSDE